MTRKKLDSEYVKNCVITEAALERAVKVLKEITPIIQDTIKNDVKKHGAPDLESFKTTVDAATLAAKMVFEKGVKSEVPDSILGSVPELHKLMYETLEKATAILRPMYEEGYAKHEGEYKSLIEDKIEDLEEAENLTQEDLGDFFTDKE